MNPKSIIFVIGTITIVIIVSMVLLYVIDVPFYRSLALLIFGVIVLFDGIISLILRYKDGTLFNIGRVIRCIAGLYIINYSLILLSVDFLGVLLGLLF